MFIHKSFPKHLILVYRKGVLGTGRFPQEVVLMITNHLWCVVKRMLDNHKCSIVKT